ncbi:MAG: hypothetical protein EPN19_07245 [Betaproteobacteria bacterium]|nr:MAG: hypothetical protein EPN19_07245 [Betaproteobacteria bacterium]
MTWRDAASRPAGFFYNASMSRHLRNGMLVLLLSALAAPAQALDPMLMFLLSAAREVISAAARAEKTPALPAPVATTRYPGTAVEPEDMRRLIDECFTYLSDAQRREIFDSLHAQLMDPKNAAVRGSMIEYFASRAAAVREAQLRLAKLSGPERDRLVTEFKVAVAAMTPEEAGALATLLRQGVLPVPGDLNDQLLAAIDAR